MSKRYFIQSTRVPDRRFQIVSVDRETKIATVQGSRATFEQSLDRDTLEGLGYRVTVEEESDDAEQP